MRRRFVVLTAVPDLFLLIDAQVCTRARKGCDCGLCIAHWRWVCCCDKGILGILYVYGGISLGCMSGRSPHFRLKNSQFFFCPPNPALMSAYLPCILSPDSSKSIFSFSLRSSTTNPPRSQIVTVPAP